MLDSVIRCGIVVMDEVAREVLITVARTSRNLYPETKGEQGET